jgi:hypothetical protein
MLPDILGGAMPIATIRQLCVPNAVVTSDTLVEQVAQIEDFATGKIDGRDFFRRNHFTAGLELLVKRGFDRLAGKSEDGAFCLTQAMGGGKPQINIDPLKRYKNHVATFLSSL